MVERSVWAITLPVYTSVMVVVETTSVVWVFAAYDSVIVDFSIDSLVTADGKFV